MLSWKATPGTSQYVVYGNKCGKGNKFKRITALSGSGRSFNVKQAAGAKLKKGVYYKFMVIAVDSDNNVISSSRVVHVSTAGNKKAANPKKVAVKAKVNAKGKKIKKAKALSKTVIKKGKAVIYAFTQNGINKKVKITVK